MLEAALWLVLQVTGILWFSTAVFDGLHFLLHRWRGSRWRLLRWAHGLHQVHHDFLDKRMQVNLGLRRANITAHILPEFAVTVICTLPFLLIFPLAAGLVLFHTHPSGDPSPSAEDLAFTRRLAEAGEVVGVRLVDHLVLGATGAWVSLRERGGW